MKLFCLSGHPNKPCFILKFKTTTIMLDCGLDTTTLINFLPLPLVQGGHLSKLPGWAPKDIPLNAKLDDEVKECADKAFVDSEPEFNVPELGMLDLAEVDVLLITNFNSMLALPFITEYTNFNGLIYATEPTLHLGRLYMEDMVHCIQKVPKLNRATKWKQPNILAYLPFPLREAVRARTWRKCYNLHDIHAAVQKIRKVGFNEKTDIFGAVTATPISSGFSLGSCNWIIQSHFEKIGYVSASSTLTTHPKPMEQAPLRNCDILLMTSLTQTPTANPDAMIGEFCVNTAMTLKNGGNVLVPCYPSGVTYDLFECLSGHLDSCGLASVPLYFISHVADSSLAYSNIYAEWLSTGKMSKVYLPEPPFPHAELVKNNRLRHFGGIDKGFEQDMKCPCVVFTGHPSLRFGDVVHFLELWGKSNSNTIVFTEPDFPYLEALAPYQPLAMMASYCPIDTSLSYSQANKLIKDLKPRHLVVPEVYRTPPVMLPHRGDLVVECDPAPATIKRAEVVKLPIKRRYEKIDVDPEVAANILPTEVKPGVAVARVSGVLCGRDNKFTLTPIPTEGNGAKKKKMVPEPKAPNHVWGALEVFEFVNHLKQEGVSDVKVEDVPGGHIVHLPSEDVLIQLEQGSTHIISQGNEALRIKLRDILLSCLGKL